jgi:ketosteroid isomerase-like protein
VAGSGEDVVRKVFEVMSSSESVDEGMAALEPLMDPEIEWVNPEDAIERGTRKGLDGMRLVLENLVAGAGTGVTGKVEELEESGDRVFVVSRLQVRGESSGAEAVGPPTGSVYTIRNGRILRIEWHYDVEKARGRFERRD